jgi:urocanate hydratase
MGLCFGRRFTKTDIIACQVLEEMAKQLLKEIQQMQDNIHWIKGATQESN